MRLGSGRRLALSSRRAGAPKPSRYENGLAWNSVFDHLPASRKPLTDHRVAPRFGFISTSSVAPQEKPRTAEGFPPMSQIQARLQALREQISEVTPQQAEDLLKAGAQLIDVRESEEIAQGSPPQALRVGRGFLEMRIESLVPDKSTPVVAMCAGGQRSLLAAETLSNLGYNQVHSLKGGFHAWKSEGYASEIPGGLSSQAKERYARHLRMPEVGEAGQEKLLASKVLLIGAGGLGSPAALYLAAAGVGTLGIVDHDRVDRSNLQRQILHTEGRVGLSKIDSARTALQALNPSIQVHGYPLRLHSQNVDTLFPEYDLVLDGTDNFPTRYLINDACIRHKIPNVHGSVYRFEGQVTVFHPFAPPPSNPHLKRGPCYRCVYPKPPPPEMAPNCSEAGVLGVLPGVIGMLQAVEALKILLGLGDSLIGKILHYEALSQRVMNLSIDPDPECLYCQEGLEFPGYVDYQELCNA